MNILARMSHSKIASAILRISTQKEWCQSMRIVILCAFLVCASSSTVSGAETATIVSSGQIVPLRVAGSAALLDAQKIAEAYGWTGKTIADSGRATTWVACRADRCVPIALDDVAHESDGGVLWIDAGALGRAMGFAVRRRDGRTELLKADAQDAIAAVPAYHANWGPGRGFKKGQTVPDIPLVDMKGNEVRFGQFLGKRYIIYGWASW